jgi:hypothetical protein
VRYAIATCFLVLFLCAQLRLRPFVNVDENWVETGSLLMLVALAVYQGAASSSDSRGDGHRAFVAAVVLLPVLLMVLWLAYNKLPASCARRLGIAVAEEGEKAPPPKSSSVASLPPKASSAAAAPRDSARAPLALGPASSTESMASVAKPVSAGVVAGAQPRGARGEGDVGEADHASLVLSESASSVAEGGPRRKRHHWRRLKRRPAAPEAVAEGGDVEMGSM